jgi:hypothetical protein
MCVAEYHTYFIGHQIWGFAVWAHNRLFSCAGDGENSGKGPYRGGPHSQMTKPGGDGLESHHMPAAAASQLPRGQGPAIQMDPLITLERQAMARWLDQLNIGQKSKIC